MKMKIAATTLATLLTVLATGAVIIHAYQQPPVPATLDFNSLSWEISSTKEEVVALEPVPLILSLCNKNQVPAIGHPAIELSDNHVELFIRRESGEWRKVDQLSIIQKHQIVTPQQMEPGECHQSKEILALNLESVFPAPGAYQIRASLHQAQGEKTLQSNILTLRRTDPVGLNAQAYNYIKAKKVSSHLFTGYGPHGSEKIKDVLEELVTLFGATAYSDYADFLLGEFYFAEKDYEKALKKFAKLEKKSDFILSEKAARYLEKIKEKSAHLEVN